MWTIFNRYSPQYWPVVLWIIWWEMSLIENVCFRRSVFLLIISLINGKIIVLTISWIHFLLSLTKILKMVKVWKFVCAGLYFGKIIVILTWTKSNSLKGSLNRRVFNSYWNMTECWRYLEHMIFTHSFTYNTYWESAMRGTWGRPSADVAGGTGVLCPLLGQVAQWRWWPYTHNTCNYSITHAILPLYIKL